MIENIVNIKSYFSKGIFIIPNYQRGYKWGVPNDDGSCAVSILMDDLIKAYEQNLEEYFIQGVTTFEEEKGEKKSITLIDGQQRTTTFFFILKYLGFDELPEINYTIRKESDYVLKNGKIESNELKFDLEKEKTENDYNLQDIFYFKKAISTIHLKLEEINSEQRSGFRYWILNSVKLFYITIDPSEATKVFSMMNGQKAIMKTDELIKSALLSKASRPVHLSNIKKAHSQELDDLLQVIKNKVGEEWEINTLRSKYAREWDKWLYWWKEGKVKDFYDSGENPLGLLLEYYFELHKGTNGKDKKYTYKNFSESFFSDAKNAKEHYKGIRDLQKKIEDWYNHYESYNYLGLILEGGGNKKEALLYLLNENKQIDAIKEYAKWTLVGATHRQIVNPSDLNEEETKEDKASASIVRISQKTVYGADGQSDALKQLLRRNVELDNKLERKFDFKLYGEKSLEHIYPKSWEKEEDSKLKFDSDLSEILSVHSIGNLVLIKKNENSQFGAKSFEDKKELYFDLNNTKWSLKFLHSVSVFSKNEWEEKEIQENQKEFISELKEYYKEDNNEQ